MQKQKRWQLILILSVIALTIYNILPTVFFYAKPLNGLINESEATQIALSATERINSLESQSVKWMRSMCNLLKIKPIEIKLDANDPQIITAVFQNGSDAQILRKYLPRAGALIPFVPSQLSLYGETDDSENKTVQVSRKVETHFDPNLVNSFFQYSTKLDDQGQATELYQALIKDRLVQLALSLGGTHQNGRFVLALRSASDPALSRELASDLSDSLLSFVRSFGETSEAAKRYFASFTQVDSENRADLAQSLITKIESCADQARREIATLSQEESGLKEQEKYLDAEKQQLRQLLRRKAELFDGAATVVRRNIKSFANGSQAWAYSNIEPSLQVSFRSIQNNIQSLPLQGRNPFIESIQLDWRNETITLVPYSDMTGFKKITTDRKEQKKLEKAEQFIFNELAYVSQQTDEILTPSTQGYQIALSELPGSRSFLAFRLASIAEAASRNVKTLIATSWNPKHQDLQPSVFPVLDYDSYLNLPAGQKKLSLVVYSPSLASKAPEDGFRTNSIYVIAKGMDKIIRKLQEDPSSEEARLFMQDFTKLKSLLTTAGYMGYGGSFSGMSKEFAGDFIFERPDYFRNVLAASGENFLVKGTKRYAVLEFTDREQRILAENKIDTREHEDLLKQRDDYRAAQLGIKGVSKFDVPKPTQSALVSNLKLSFIKYFRGDERKILHWGLDLSGGKTVQIELRDSNNRQITNEADIKQGINELYARVNKMGVSEVGIRQEGNLITLDFPGSQNLSASELVKASSMYFHVVNEKFSPNNPSLEGAVNHFLQEVWNEAVVTNRKGSQEIAVIAWKHLYGDAVDPDGIQPRSESAKLLYDQGLRLSNPVEGDVSSAFDDTYSTIALFRGDDYTEWHGQTHPLLIVFRNFALEGSNLDDVRASYDPSRGNFLAFGIKGSYTAQNGIKLNPRESLQAWTTPFSREKVAGTSNGQFSRNHGWRMAVLLNGTIVSAPTLDSPLKDSGMITGGFSQREINQLEADLKAGSLSFTPKILSEKNISPDLGSKERALGIWATVIAFALVVGVMIAYYRFCGLVAAVAVLLNLLIMWATLQNIGATITLASLAGLILTVGMAVDANVLVFERIREEFAATGKIASAVRIGYKKAFSAILDSNVTTLIAALILLNFDAGPIKGLAVTLIIGLVSSMFTALFMTRYFFTGWIQNSKNQSLHMMNLFRAKKFNFLKYGKATLTASILIIFFGGILLIRNSNSLFGMDFTGGYSVALEVRPSAGTNYRDLVEQSLIKAGAKPQEIQVRELTPSNNVKIFLSRSLDLSGFSETQAEEASDISPVLNAVVNALNKNHVILTEESMAALEQNWSVVSGQMSETMRNQALIGLLIALICIFLYITIRFEFKYAISATICLAHDIFFTIAVVALLNALKIPVQIDLNTVAALMTIVGYSLNDTIIVFDRIREDVKELRRLKMPEVINHALNVTLSRTILTSGTTLMVLIPLVAMGGSTIFGFALVMLIGVVFGTLSSLFIAAPLMLFFHERELKKQQKIELNG